MATGALTFKRVSSADTNVRRVTSRRSVLLGWYLSNHDTLTYSVVRLFDQVATPNLATDASKLTLPLPRLGAANLSMKFKGIPFDHGMWIAITANIPDFAATGVSGSEVVVNLVYELT